MRISSEDIDHLAKLARLRLSDSERQHLSEDLAGILEHMEVLRDVTAGGTQPMDTQVDGVTPLRADRVEFDALQLPPRELAPVWEEPFFVVPRLSALDEKEVKGPENESS